MPEREIYELDGCHDHGSDDDHGIPFWKRAPITVGQLAALQGEIKVIEHRAIAAEKANGKMRWVLQKIHTAIKQPNRVINMSAISELCEEALEVK